jgi:Tfp pilus assembly protein PilX
MPKINSRKGFALPMALLVMIVLTAGIAAGFAATSAEVISNAAHRGDNRAYNLAEAGLEQFLNRRKETDFCKDTTSRPAGSSVGGVRSTTLCLVDPADPAADSEWTRIWLSGGYADVKSVLVRKYVSDTLPALFFIRSTGVDTTTKLSGASSTVMSKRTVGMFAAWSKAVVDVQGAWFALSGLNKNGASGAIDGTDQCGSAPTVAGAVVPSGQFSGNTSAFTGTPRIDSSKTFATLKASVKLDWAGILGGSIQADFVVPPTSNFPSSAWFAANPNSWPTIRVHSQSFGLPNAGRGMIIADSNMSISGSNMWDGIVMIGGALTSNGNNTTAGATYAGLNYLLGGTPGGSTDDSDANGTKTYVYNSCNVSKAAVGLRIYKPWNNTWLDNIPVW